MKSKIMYIIYNFIFNFICVYTGMFFIMIVASLVGSFTFLVPEYSYNFIKAFHAIRFWETLKFSAIGIIPGVVILTLYMPTTDNKQEK